MEPFDNIPGESSIPPAVVLRNAHAGPEAPGMTEAARPTEDPEFNRILSQREQEIQAEKPEAKEWERRDWKIVVNGTTLQEKTDLSLDALADANSTPFIFNRSRSLVRVQYDEGGNPAICSLNEAGVRGVLERCADYVRVSLEGNETPVPPPLDVVRDLMNLPEWVTIPPLTGITEVPIVLPDGGLVLSPGYDRKTRLFYAPAPGLVIPPVPDKPEKESVVLAIEQIKEIFTDFPFVDDSSRANMIAALITAVLRPMVAGPVPMAIIDKPQAGTGATLLSEVIATIATGRPAELMTAPEDDAAWRKAITASLSQGRNLAIVDNVETKLYAASLAAVLTSNVWTDRILGRSENVSLNHSMFWISTGNNLQLGGDLPRRCFWIRLDAQEARPWKRTGYKHPDLISWVASNRGKILAAILTIARGWIRAGRQKPSDKVPRMGSFEGWRDTIGGILEYCGIPAFLGNQEEMFAQADADGPQWESFVEKWFSIWGVRAVTVADIHAQIQREGDSANVAFGSDRLVDHLPDNLADALAGKKNFARVLGHSLSKMNGRKFLCGLALRKGKDSHKVATWIVSQPDQAKPTDRGVI